MLFTGDGKEHGLSDDALVVGHEVSRGVWVLSSGIGCMLPFKETWCASNLFRHNTAGGSGPEVRLE